MNIPELLNDKFIKPKEKTETLAKWLLENENSLGELIAFAKTAKDPAKATCIEAIEYATNSKPEIASLACFEFVSASLADKAPRIKWESSRVVGNIAHLYPGKLDKAIINLLINSEHEGTVVRWSTAFALGQIIKFKTPHNKELIHAAEAICQREEKNSIIKIYLAALKKVKV